MQISQVYLMHLIKFCSEISLDFAHYVVVARLGVIKVTQTGEVVLIGGLF